jgi:nondiscriminating glutamyl-tRNA synthetase
MENSSSSKVRVRIAPSPTGFVHIGNLRTILYNYLFARHHGGQFIVRIEDTDRTRLVPGAIEDLLKTLEWAGLDYDEGPKLSEKGITEAGEYGPYVQSDRLPLYTKHINTLLEKGKAYHCFCSKERLDTLRADQEKNHLPPKYDNHCRDLGRDEVAERLKNKEPHVIRFKMPEEKDIVFEDAIRGAIVTNTKDLDDFVLIKSDGYPTYHAAVVVDDHLMKITHVLRGEEWIPSTPKHILQYDAYGWHAPIFAHLPNLLNANRKKMSKRDGDVSVKDFIDRGYLRDALINFIALLGWNSGTEQEIYNLPELGKQFSLEKVHKAGPIFDLKKLDWINGYYLRQLNPDQFLEACLPFLEKANLLKISPDSIKNTALNKKIARPWLVRALGLAQTRIHRLEEASGEVDFLLQEDLEYDAKQLVWKKSDAEKTQANLQSAVNLLKAIDDNEFTKANIENVFMKFIEEKNLGVGDMLWPLRFALSGRAQSAGPFELAEVLGKETTIDRVGAAIAKLKN